MMIAAQATEYFVDAEMGRDGNSGLSTTEPWQTVRRVNLAALKPGDTVRFKAGGTWRESLFCQSGEEGQPVTYTSYGDGPKPVLLASVDLAAEASWVDLGDHIWATRADEITASRAFPEFAPGDWGIYCDGDGLATMSAATNEQGEKVYTLRGQKTGQRSTNIQLNYIGIPLEPEQFIRYRFRAKATKPFAIQSVSLMRAQNPWGAYGTELARSTDITAEWGEHEVVFRTTVAEPVTDGRLSFFIGDTLPEDCEFSFVPLGAELLDYRSLGLTDDVGNIILVAKDGTDKTAAWKRWDRESLKNQGDFFHDPADKRLYFYSERNPAAIYSMMEAARKRIIVRFGSTRHAVVDGFTIAYSGAHGANGSGCRHGIIRNCDFLWIGGSHLYTRNDRPTRYGNGVEFWNGCENMTVENNYFEEVYDTAMTNQGPEPGLVRNMVWRNNRTLRCEQAYEIWFSNAAMVVDGLLVTGNEFVDSGFGWSHAQRPDKRGCHLLGYGLTCKIVDIRYEHNIFRNAKDAPIWFSNSRLAEFNIDHNTYIQPGAGADTKLFRWVGVDREGVTFDEYRKLTGNDANSTLQSE